MHSKTQTSKPVSSRNSKALIKSKNFKQRLRAHGNDSQKLPHMGASLSILGDPQLRKARSSAYRLLIP